MWRITRFFAIAVGIVVCFSLQASKARDEKDEGNKKTAFDHNPVCPIGCVTCSAYNGCVTCQRRHFLFLQWHGMRQTGSCVDRCPDGFFGLRKKGHGKCLICSVGRCEVCSNRTTCTRCDLPFYLVDGQCVDQCPDKIPYAGRSRQCSKKVDCEVGPWNQWGTCGRKGLTCGYKYGLQKRRRRIIQTPSDNGLQCPVTVQFRKCRMKHRFCEDTETNESDMSKVIGLNEVNWKRLERLLIKHRKRKQHSDAKKSKNKHEKTKRTKKDFLKLQTTSPQTSAAGLKAN